MSQTLESSLSARRHQLFASLWAVAHLFQLASVTWIFVNLHATPPTAVGWTELALLFSSVGLLLFPASRKWLLFVAGLQVMDSWLSLPELPNHRLVTSCANIGIFLVYCSRRPVEECFDRFAPALRVAAIIVYAFATFHKLNSSFFAPEVSCTTVFYRQILGALPFLPTSDFVLTILPYLTILTEGGIPLLLLFPRTRATGLAIALVFHSMLTFDVQKHFFDFSSTMFAILSAFLPDNAIRSFSRAPLSSRYPALRLGLLIWYMLAILALFLSLDTRYGYSGFFVGRQLLWWTINLWLILAFAALFRRGWTDGSLSGKRTLCGLTVGLPIVLFFNGITPYLGLKTRSSLDMYSNLRAEAGRENHFIVRKTADLLGNTADLVVVISTSDASLMRDVVQPGLLITFFELQRRVLKNPGMQLRFNRGGTEYNMLEAGKDPIFANMPSRALLRMLWYRPIDPRTPARCLW